jgi:DNA-binding transcriptional LysR family regulator
VRVTVTEALGMRIVVPVLAALRSSHPDLRVDLETSVRTFDLARGEADIAIRVSTERPSDSGIVSRKLGLVGYALYASESYLAKRGSPKRGAGLSGHDLIAFVGRRWPESLGPMFMGESVDGARLSLGSNDQSVQLQAAIEGIGIAEFPCFLAERYQQLKRLWPAEASLFRTVWLATHRDLRRAARISVVSAAITNCFEHNARILRYGRPGGAVR